MVVPRASLALTAVALLAPAIAKSQIATAPAAVNFGAVLVGKAAVAKISVFSASDVSPLKLAVQPPFRILVPPPTRLFAGRPLAVWIEFQPTTASSFSADLTANGVKVPLAGEGTAPPQATVRPPSSPAPAAIPREPPPMPQPPQLLAAPSAHSAAPAAATPAPEPIVAPPVLAVDSSDATIKLSRNQQTGSAVVTVSQIAGVAIGSVAAPTPLPGVFSLSSDCPNHAPAATTCTITANATLSAGGMASEAVNVLSPSGGVLAKTGFTVLGNYSQITAAAATVPFGGVSVGDTATRPVTLTNGGEAAATLAVQSATPGSFSAQGCDQLLYTQCTLSIAYSPTQQVAEAGTITLQPSDGGPPVAINLSGTGLPSSLSVLPANLDFTGVPAETQELTIINPTSRSISILGVSTNGPFTASNPCASLAPGQSCSIPVQYQPNSVMSGIAADGQLSIISADPVAVSNVALHVAAHRATLALDRSSVAFGAEELGATASGQSIVVTNTGQTATDVGVQSAGDFGASGCAQLQPGASCSVSLTFTPSAPGERSGIAVISGGGSNLTVGLNGEAVAPAPKPDRDIPLAIGSGLIGGFALSLPRLSRRAAPVQEKPAILVTPKAVSLNCATRGHDVATSITIRENLGRTRHLSFAVSGPFSVTGCELLEAHGECTAGVSFHPQNSSVNGLIVITDKANSKPLAAAQVSGAMAAPQISLGQLRVKHP